MERPSGSGPGRLLVLAGSGHPAFVTVQTPEVQERGSQLSRGGASFDGEHGMFFAKNRDEELPHDAFVSA